MKRRNAFWLALLLAAPAVSACDRGEPGAAPSAEGPVDVVVSRLASSAPATRFPATVEGQRQAELATRASGIVQGVEVDVGSHVSRGDVLVQLDASDVEARIERAEAAVRQAARWHDRIEALEADGAATSQELDDAVARLRMAEASLEEAEAQRAYSVLRAPFSGVVRARSVDPGDLAVPGRPVLTLVDPAALEAVADLPAALEGTVRPGRAVRLIDPATGARFSGVVSRLSPAIETASRRFRAEIEFSGGRPAGVLPGTFLRLELTGPAPSTLWIPSDAAVRRGQLTAVFVVDADVLRLRWIRPGLERGAALEVLAGLSEGEAVVRRPGPTLADGLAVGEVRVEEFSPDLEPTARATAPAEAATASGVVGG